MYMSFIRMIANGKCFSTQSWKNVRCSISLPTETYEALNTAAKKFTFLHFMLSEKRDGK